MPIDKLIPVTTSIAAEMKVLIDAYYELELIKARRMLGSKDCVLLAKYIVVEEGKDLRAIIFDSHLQHNNCIPVGTKPVSAGFFRLHSDLTVSIGGSSSTLNLESSLSDDIFIARALGIKTDAPTTPNELAKV